VRFGTVHYAAWRAWSQIGSPAVGQTFLPADEPDMTGRNPSPTWLLLASVRGTNDNRY
jgi:hypothetical protein